LFRKNITFYISYNEGFGFPPLESQYFANPVLASAEGSLPEVLGDSVEYVVNEEDIKDIV
jgi:glycosyltransferase involved in cell wall biosynthesis